MEDIKLKNYTLPISNRTLVMGVLNVTPDSFSDGGKYLETDDAVEQALRLVSEGADIIDIGGESSRPGSKSITASSEKERVIPVVKALKGKINVPISVDTAKSEVAYHALKEGASIINDITALNGDSEMAKVISDFNAGVILMHMQGIPENMQTQPKYDDIIEEISGYLKNSINIACESNIDPDKIIIDPGIGFGKTLSQNLFILKNLQEFKRLGKPILIGTSRKSFIGELTGKDVSNRLFGTAASISMAINSGADIIRVHDVGEMKDVIDVTNAIIGV